MSLFQRDKKDFKKISPTNVSSLPVVDEDEIGKQVEEAIENKGESPEIVAPITFPQERPIVREEESIEELEQKLKRLKEEKLRKEREEQMKNQQFVKLRAVPTEFMFNEISDRLDTIENWARQLSEYLKEKGI